MTQPHREAMRELIEQARELRRSEQPPADLFEAALARLRREEHALRRSRRFSLSSAQSVIRRMLLGGPGPLGLALALALALIVGWGVVGGGAVGGGAPRQNALESHQQEPTVALGPEPAPPTGSAAGANARASSTSHAENALPPIPENALPPIPEIEPQPERLETNAGTKPHAKPARPPKTDCKPPWWIDAEGIQRLEMDCMSSHCEPPWDIDAQGTLRVKQECPSSAGKTAGKTDSAKKKAPTKGSTTKRADKPPPDCEPPWFIDPNGKQRLKPKCL